jgi:two-component system NarL family sensor kinase
MAREHDVTRPAHPADYRASILLAALVAVAVWWGLGLPYSLTTWLLDGEQVRWTLICYAWEVPAAGLLGPVVVPQIWWRDVMRRWDRVFAVPGRVDAIEAGAVEAMILDYPIRVGWVLLATSLVGYGVGAIQLWVFAALPIEQIVNVALLGVVTGLLGALFAFLYLERLLTPLLFELGRTRPLAPPAGRRVPLRTKVFACSLVIMVATVPLFGTVFWNQSARVLEQEAGKRLLVLARDAAADADTSAPDRSRQGLAPARELGKSGRAYVIDAEGRVVGGDAGPVRRLTDEGFRGSVVATILSGPAGHLVDRTGAARIVAFARMPDGERRVVIVVPRAELQQEMSGALRTAAAIFLATLSLALGSGFLFSRRLGRPIELVTAVANRSAREPDTAWELAPVRTNDEVGELAVALNHMTSRLGEARDALARINVELEDRVREATRNVTSLYDTTRAITSTLEVEDVLPLTEQRIVAALGLRDVVLMRTSPVDGTVDGYATGSGRLDLGADRALAVLLSGVEQPCVWRLADVGASLPPPVRAVLAGPDLLCMPLVFKGSHVGLILGSLTSGVAPPDLEFAGALANQAAVALANVGLFETVHHHEIELRELSERQVQLREEMLRSVSRELHDGLGQALAAIKVDLASIDHVGDQATLRERVREVHLQVTELIQEVRRMSQLLRPSMLDDLGLMPSLRTLVESVSARAGIAIDLCAPMAERRLPPAIEVLLFRVTQEALTNMVKHARARTARVELALNATHAVLTITDDGVGFDVDDLRRPPTSGRGIGLLGMRERVAYHHGSIDIRSQPREGVSITLSIPIDGADGV